MKRLSQSSSSENYTFTLQGMRTFYFNVVLGLLFYSQLSLTFSINQFLSVLNKSLCCLYLLKNSYDCIIWLRMYPFTFGRIFSSYYANKVKQKGCKSNPLLVWNLRVPSTFRLKKSLSMYTGTL